MTTYPDIPSDTLDFDIAEFDIDISTFFVTDLPQQPIITNSRCNFKECIQTKTKDLYFCDYHANMVHQTCCKFNYMPPPQEKKQKITTKCAVKQCRREQTEESYLCNFHFLSLETVNLKLAFLCREKGCKKVKKMNQKKCVDHIK